MIINTCFGGFGIREDIEKKLGLDTLYDEDEIRTNPELIAMIEAGEDNYDEATKKFVLLKGSILASDVVNSYKPINNRNKFIKEHCKNENGQITLQNDVPFNSPSGASGYVLGRPSNGWDDWKDAEGKKLSEVVQR